MRKFRIKNRKKRKYTRKAENQTIFYFSKIAAIGVISPFLIVISMFTLFMIFQSSPHPSFDLTLPEINIVSLLTGMIKAVSEFIIFLYTITVDTLQTAAALIRSAVETIITIFLVISATVINWITFVFLCVVKVIGSLVVLITNTILTIFIYSYNLFLTVLNAIMDFIIFLAGKIVDFVKSLARIIEWPFIKLAKDVRVFDPIFNKLRELFAESANNFLSNLQGMLKFMFQLSKYSHRPS